MKRVTYEILINENRDTKFMTLDWYLEKEGLINLKDYLIAYKCVVSLSDENKTFDVIDTLENIYHLFNNNHPKDYKSRSLSIGDLVKINDEYYMVESIGFKKVNGEMISNCKNCYHYLVNGCKLKTKNDFLKVKGFCNCYSFSNRNSK
jgi:hypothetical protein